MSLTQKDQGTTSNTNIVSNFKVNYIRVIFANGGLNLDGKHSWEVGIKYKFLIRKGSQNIGQVIFAKVTEKTVLVLHKVVA